MKTLSVNYYFYVLKILEGMGLERNKAAHITPFSLEQNPHPSVRIKMEALRSLLALAETELKDPLIGLNVSHNFRISNYGYAGNIFAMCDDIEHAMTLTRKYGCLAHSFGTFSAKAEIDEASKTVRYIWLPSFERSDDELYRHITECVISNYALTINWLLWSFGTAIQELSFRHSPTKPLSDYRKVLNCDVEFGAKENSFALDLACHKSPLPTANPVKLSGLQNTLNRNLAAYNLESDLTQRVKHSLYDLIEHTRPSLTLVADDLSLSERTLKRQLKNEGTRFQNVLRTIKMELCSAYMKEGLAFSDIAQRLWYYDQSALTRAYKNWHGVPPSHNKM